MLKGNRCDFKHPKTTLKPPQTMKCNIPCPFLEKRGYCLKKNMCDYYHDELLYNNPSPRFRTGSHAYPNSFLSQG